MLFHLFVSEGFDGIGRGSPEGLGAYCQEGHEKGSPCGQDEGPETEADPVGESLKPVRHCIISDRAGDKIGEKDENDEFSAQMGNQLQRRGPHHLTDADLFGSAFDGEGGETQETQAGYDDSQNGESPKDLSSPTFFPVEGIEIVVEEKEVEGLGGCVPLEDVLQKSYGFRNIA